jgi:hypothetical protein
MKIYSHWKPFSNKGLRKKVYKLLISRKGGRNHEKTKNAGWCFFNGGMFLYNKFYTFARWKGQIMLKSALYRGHYVALLNYLIDYK